MGLLLCLLLCLVLQTCALRSLHRASSLARPETALRDASLSSQLAQLDLDAILSKALDSGRAGASAGALQVVSLMWLRTTLNYQYSTGKSTRESMDALWKEGGPARFYQGLPFALLQSPLSRFGDTASNSLILSALDGSGIPSPLVTLLASVCAGAFRVVLMPVDTFKTAMQVNGESGVAIVLERVREKGPSTLFYGSLAASAATVVGHFPWFLTFNFLSAELPTPQELLSSLQAGAQVDASTASAVLAAWVQSTDARLLQLLRSAFIGLVASSTSDVCSNSLRVLKTVRQSDKEGLTYADSVKSILSKDGWGGLLGRGLGTRLVSNALQGVMFSVLFKYFQAANR